MILKKHCAGSDYNVIIVDWSMPDMDGLEVIRRARAEIGNDVPIIIVSAYDVADIEAEAREAGANDLISKPLFKSSLSKTLKNILKLSDVENEKPSKYDISGMNILIAEDNDLNYEIAKTLIEYEGASCARAENGRVCVDILEAGGKPDLVLMDMQMPVMKGLDAARLIRSSENEDIRNIPIIAMTADAFAENIQECIDAGMDGHIAKPIDISVILSEIQKVMNKNSYEQGGRVRMQYRHQDKRKSVSR
jgi:CheY-like chemotaxis protein